MNNKGLLFCQTLGHFCVDASCAAVVISATQDFMSAVQFFVLYNFLAFCLQPLAGILLDKVKKLHPRHYIIASFVLLLWGFVPEINIWGRIFLVGWGNCLFHVGAGTLILTSSQNKMAPLGIFVSTGAVGLFLGTILAHSFTIHFTLAFLLFVLILLNLKTYRKKSIKSSQINHGWMAFFLCWCVAIRSFMGFMPLTQFEKTPLILLLIMLGDFMGKALGGILCDKLGISKVVYVSTIFVLMLFLLSFQNPYLWMIVQMIINLSMPITLYFMYKSMPRYPAFSFGLAASFLVVGLLFTFLFKGIDIHPSCFLILFVINSSIIILSERKLR